MNRPPLRLLQTELEEGLKQLLRSVRRVPVRPPVQASMAWRIADNANTAAYVVLVVHHQMDEFTIELAWSRHKRIPPKQDTEPGNPMTTEESRFRLSRLWRRYGSEVWYTLHNEADVPDVIRTDPFPDPFPDEQLLRQWAPIKAKRALNALEQYAIPYLRTVIGLAVE